MRHFIYWVLLQIWSATALEGRWAKYSYKEIIVRDKTSLGITWLKDKSFADLDILPDPDVLAEEIADNLESAGNNLYPTQRLNAFRIVSTLPTEEVITSFPPRSLNAGIFRT